MGMMKYISSFCLLVLLISCNTDEDIVDSPDQVISSSPTVFFSGTYTLFHQGQDRIYHYYHPIGLPENAPLVFVLHGYDADAANFMDWLSMEEIADEQGFAVVYPQGSDDDTRRPHWNADLTISSVDDVGFLRKLALELQETYNLNPDKTFVSGFSNGGFMSYELIIKEPEVFKAAASIAGTMSGATWESRSIASPVPLLQLSGGLDRIVPVNGVNTRVGGWDGAPAISSIVEFWADVNQADVQEETTQDRTIINKYINTETGNEVWYYLLQDLGHNIPMGDPYNVDTPSLIWEFFSRY